MTRTEEKYYYDHRQTSPVSSPTGEYPYIIPTPSHLEQKQGKNYCRYCRSSYSQRALIAEHSYCWKCKRALAFMIYGDYCNIHHGALRAYLYLSPKQWQRDYEAYAHRLTHPTPEDVAKEKAWEERVARLDTIRAIGAQIARGDVIYD
jgi:hypothetical protein